MKRGLEVLLACAGLVVVAWAALWFFQNVMEIVQRPPEVRPAVRLANQELAKVQPAQGWFPSPKQPIFDWETDLENWQLEADNPLDLLSTESSGPTYPAKLGVLPITSDREETPGGRTGTPASDRRPPRSESGTPQPAADAPDLPSASASASAPAKTADPQKKAKGSLGSLRLGDEHTSTPASHHSLKVPVNFPDPATLYRIPPGLSGARYIAYDVYVPLEARGYVGCLFFLKDKDGLWYQARSRVRLAPGEWTTLTADLRGDSPDVTPLGHGGHWDENQASQVRTIGLTFYGDQPFKGYLWLDNFRGWLSGERFKRLMETLPPEGEAPGGVTLSKERRHELAELAQKLPRTPDVQADKLRLLNFRTDPLMPPENSAAESGASALAVGLYQTLTVRFELNRQVSNPFDPQQVEVQAKVEALSGKVTTVNGFWYQDFERHDRFEGDELTPVGRPEWRIRITPKELGDHRVTISVRLNEGKESVQAAPLTFVVIPSRDRGFLKVSKKDPSFFEFEDGSFFYPIGHNIHSPVDLRCWKEVFKKEPPLPRGLKMYSSFFPKMSAAGENVGEVWMASWWLGIEWTQRWRNYHGAGRYCLENAWKLDRLLEEARRNGLYIHLVIDNHGKFSQWCDWEWNLNPYNRLSDPADGWVEKPSEFFTNEKARRLHRQRLRYIAARWGADPTLLGWELVSEFDLVGDGSAGANSLPGPSPMGRRYCTSPPARNWLREMMSALREYDAYGHPVTNHYATNFSIVDKELAESPLFDYITGDAYRNEPGYSSMALAWTQFFANARKPFWVTEFGGDWNATSIPRLEADLHCGLWSTWTTQAAGTPLFWWYDLVDRRDLYPHYRAFANFIKGEDRRGLAGQPELAALPAPHAALSCAQYRWKDGAYVWVFNSGAMHELPEPGSRFRQEGVELRIPGLAAGQYTLEYWDTYAGKPVNTTSVELPAGQELLLQFPPFECDMAAKVKQAKPAEVTTPAP